MDVVADVVARREVSFNSRHDDIRCVLDENPTQIGKYVDWLNVKTVNTVDWLVMSVYLFVSPPVCQSTCQVICGGCHDVSLIILIAMATEDVH